MLKHKRLQITCEDEVIRALHIWVLDPCRTQEEISMVVTNICWNYVSLQCLFDFIMNCPIVRQNIDFQTAFKKEILLRSQFKFEEDWFKRLSEPRFCYLQLQNQLNSTQQWRT